MEVKLKFADDSSRANRNSQAFSSSYLFFRKACARAGAQLSVAFFALTSGTHIT